VDAAVGLLAGQENAAVVGVAGREVMGDGDDDAARHLRPAGAVEEDRVSALDDALQGRKLRTEGLDREGGHGLNLVGLAMNRRRETARMAVAREGVAALVGVAKWRTRCPGAAEGSG